MKDNSIHFNGRPGNKAPLHGLRSGRVRNVNWRSSYVRVGRFTGYGFDETASSPKLLLKGTYVGLRMSLKKAGVIAAAGIVTVTGVLAFEMTSAHAATGWKCSTLYSDTARACISQNGNTISGTGSHTSRIQKGAIMWIEVHNVYTGANYGVHMGNSVTAKNLPKGTYEVVYYMGNGGGSFGSPKVVIR